MYDYPINEPSTFETMFTNASIAVVVLLVGAAVLFKEQTAEFISFIGLLAPHLARLLTRHNRVSTMALSGLLRGILLCGADILARSVAATELPVSIFTSLLGAPFLILMILRARRSV